MRLILVRHAKSDWSNGTLRDHDRPLNRRGRDAAAAVGGWLDRSGHVPDIAHVSTARRAGETWEIAAGVISRPVPARAAPALYNAAPEAILSEIAEEKAECVLVLAHNPGLAALAQWLVRETPKRVEFHRFPTGATLVLEIRQAGWRNLAPRCGDVVGFIVPRDLQT